MNRKQRRAGEASKSRLAGSPNSQVKSLKKSPPGRMAGNRFDRSTIGLCMIVKNESKVILRCLESVRPLVDYVLIEDTGSTDGTQQIIREWLRQTGVPGEVIEAPWQDFAYNRSHVLARLRAREDIEYALIMDADDNLTLPAGYALPKLDADSYMIEVRHHELSYFRTQIVRNALPWRYEGVIHEFLSTLEFTANHAGSQKSGTKKCYPAPLYVMHDDGARRLTDNKSRYARDAAVIDTALEVERDPFLRSRYTFYLGQSYQEAGEPERALDAYRKRSTMGFWDEEIFISLYRAAQIMEQLGYPEPDVIEAYIRASDTAKTRAEAFMREADSVESGRGLRRAIN